MQQFSQSLPMMLYGALDAVMPRFRAVFKEFGLTEQQWRVLRVLWEQDPMPFGRLSDLTLISTPSLVGVVDRIRSMGLVEKVRSETDRRSVFVSLTPAGRRLQAKVMPLVDATYAELQASVEPGAWQALLNGLQEVRRIPPAASQHTEATA